MKEYSQIFTVRPKSKQRPRMSRKGYAYTPKQTVAFERLIAGLYKGPMFAEDTPLKVTLEFMDKTIELRIREMPKKPQSKLKGDIDNYAKSILDALNGVAYKDDKQVVILNLEKS